IAATARALQADADLLSADERAAIDSALETVSRARQGTDRAALHAAIDALSRATMEFAARRMDRSVKQALAGKSVDSLA
ncbi:MAG TPA: Fe-S protein assembly chaperone HscA, partial [Casimicrobiaceae bacterium]|nr:Fe-S protein assembly chaperone HscA [Casimicrobiaceae bacterium]